MVNLTKHTQTFNLKKTPTNNYQIDLQKKNTNSQNLSLKNILGNLANQFSPLDVVPALPGLVPVAGTPFYANPNSPAAPDDCDLYPNSPFCGGNPFTFTPIGIEPAIVLDPCHLGIQLTPVLGFIKLPPVQVVYHSNAPECQPPSPPPASVLPPDNAGFCLEFVCSRPGAKGEVTAYFSGLAAPRQIQDFIYPGYSSQDSAIENAQKYQAFAGEAFPYFGPADETAEGTRKKFSLSVVLTKEYDFTAICVLNDNLRTLDDERLNLPSNAWRIELRGSPSQRDTSYTLPFRWLDINVSFACSLSPYAPPPPLPMQCCPPAFNPAILQLILTNQEKIMAAIGTEEYPATLPKSLISKDDGWLGNLIPDETVQVKSLTSFVAWFFERVDEVFGQWEIPIEIKDSDPTTPGDQPKGFKLSNLAEAQAELMQLVFQSFLNTEVLLSITTRNLLESGQIKQQDFKNFALTQALVDYLGFSYKDVQRNLPLTFTLNKEDFDELLVESEVKVAVAEFDDKVTFRKELLKLLDAAAITKAVNWRKLDATSGADVKQQIKDVIKNQAAMLKKLSDNEEDANGDDNLDRFIKDAKTAFSNQPGMPPISQPFGRDIDEGPEIERFDA